ncbi:NPR2-domain-containing protein [Serendipita vermifera]|nr:NPR2-domain-containing protein [Serendipita vermifera]
MSISSIFFAIFDDSDGPRIVYQVPENLITVPPKKKPATVNSSTTSLDRSTETLSQPSPAAERDLTDGPADSKNESISRTTSASAVSLNSAKNDGAVTNGLKTSSSSTRIAKNLSQSKTSSLSPYRASAYDPSSPDGVKEGLFEWELVSGFAIPRPDICGRLTISTTRKHRIVGFPVIIRNEKKYDRGTFQFNVCFVFKKDIDVSCYEPIVRKLARILTACEIDHSFLSSSSTPRPLNIEESRQTIVNEKIYPMLEQIYADLNAFSETSIRIDQYNSIELRIFPRYPNPPAVHSWDVPVPLIDLASRMEPNWDLTMRKISPFIDGVDHVKKIAQKAEADLDLVKECVRQVMMYQCVMLIDIFQFSNIYTLCRPVMWLFTDPAVYEECGPYVRKGSAEVKPWPRLAWYYARLKAPLTVGKWITQYNVDMEAIDVRRFITFGIIKGFLRRVHRWPVLLKDEKVPYPLPPTSSLEQNQLGVPLASQPIESSIETLGPRNPNEATSGPAYIANPSLDKEVDLQPAGFSVKSTKGAFPPGLGSGVVETGGERSRIPPGGSLLQRRLTQATVTENTARPTIITGNSTSTLSERLEGKEGGRGIPKQTPTVIGGLSATIPNSLPSTSNLKSRLGMGGGPAPSAEHATESGDRDVSKSAKIGEAQLVSPTGLSEMSDQPHALSLPIAQELAEQAHAQSHAVAKAVQNKNGTAIGGFGRAMAVEVPPDLTELLDGTHHSDELCVHFGLSWSVLQVTLGVLGGATGDDGDLGRVVIILR